MCDDHARRATDASILQLFVHALPKQGISTHFMQSVHYKDMLADYFNLG